MATSVKTTIVIPAYNEEKRIATTLDAYVSYIKAHNLAVTLSVILNGCKDNTEGVVSEYAKQYPEYVSYNVIPQAIGKGGAVVYGMSRATTEYVGFTDADNSVTPEWFFKLLRSMIDHPQLAGAVSSRALPASILQNRNRGRMFVSGGFNWGVNFLFNLGIKDTQCGAKLFRKSTLDTVLPEMQLANMAFDVDLLYNCKKAGFKIQEIPIHWIDVEGLTTNNPTKISLIMGLSTFELRLIHSPFSFLRFLLHPIWMLLLKPAARPLRFIQKDLVFKQ
jgi:glycosyltransferase involved in cell wall biosynthesis